MNRAALLILMLCLSVLAVFFLSKTDNGEEKEFIRATKAEGPKLDERLKQKKLEEISRFLGDLKFNDPVYGLEQTGKYIKYIKSRTNEDNLNRSSELLTNLELIRKTLEFIEKTQANLGAKSDAFIDSLMFFYCQEKRLKAREKEKIKNYFVENGYKLNCDRKNNSATQNDNININAVNYEKLIRSFFEAEDRQDEKAVSNYYEENIEQYFNYHDLSKQELMDIYRNIWDRIKAKNEIVSVDSVGANQFIVTTDYTWRSKSNTNKGAFSREKVVLHFKDQKIYKIYNK